MVSVQEELRTPEAPAAAPLVFADLIASYQLPLVRLAYALCGNWASAEDCVADAFAATWPHFIRGQVTDPDRYLHRAVVNRVASYHRSRARERTRLARIGPPDDAQAGPAEATADIDWVRRTMQALPPGHREVVALRYLQDRPEAEVASILGIPVGTVKSRLSRAMKQLRQAAEAEDDGV
ncbi:MAG: RNA polymerase sigma factor [Actinomycetota bacterium]